MATLTLEAAREAAWGNPGAVAWAGAKVHSVIPAEVEIRSPFVALITALNTGAVPEVWETPQPSYVTFQAG